MILVMPHWTNAEWYPDAHAMATKKYFYRRGVEMFETDEGTVGGTRWPVWALLLDGGLEEPNTDMWGEQKFVWGPTAARRRRRKRK